MGTRGKKTRWAYLLNAGLTLLLFVVLLVLIQTRILRTVYTDLLTMVCINIILVVSLNLVTGILGQLVLGHAGFMLAGAYVASIFTLHSGLPLAVAFPIGLVLAGLFAAVCGLIIGIPTLRLRGDYLAIITLGFGEIIRVIGMNLKITGGAMGLSGIRSLSNRQNPAVMFIYAFVIAVIVIVINFTFGRSRHGRAVLAIREDEIAAESMGVNTTYYKLFAFVLAAFLAGVAGGIYAHQVGMIEPGKFDFNRSVEILIMVVLGGMGSISGSIISATVLTILPELLRDFSQYRMLIYSIILICVMLFRPEGLLGRHELSLAGLIDKGKKALAGRKKTEEG